MPAGALPDAVAVGMRGVPLGEGVGAAAVGVKAAEAEAAEAVGRTLSVPGSAEALAASPGETVGKGEREGPDVQLAVTAALEDAVGVAKADTLSEALVVVDAECVGEMLCRMVEDALPLAVGLRLED